jgi:hypothetical protein
MQCRARGSLQARTADVPESQHIGDDGAKVLLEVTVVVVVVVLVMRVCVCVCVCQRARKGCSTRLLRAHSYVPG